MTTFPGSPQVIKGGIALVDPSSGALQRLIVLQYNPDTLTRTLQIQSIGESAEKGQVLRIKGPPIESIKLDAEIDATDQLEFPNRNPVAVETGIHPQLAALETIVYPTSAQLNATNALAQAGTLEVAPMAAPLALFIWSKNRIVPIRITDFSITEELFDPNLSPVRAKVSLGMRVMSVNDLSFTTKGGSLFMSYLQQKERLAQRSRPGSLRDLGIPGGLP